ncbi:MAG: hypothetical protein JWL60_2223 [Gemmatimonadetes bacterium]|nr:hypothetical protein [Gemmatimonadota bacterium]
MLRVCPECRERFDASLERCPADGALLGAPSRPSVAIDPLLGQLLADRYRIQRLLGEGGMGRVYLAEHERMGRRSAVKVMSPSQASTPEAISRFNREAANASRIHQPNVAAIYDFGETPEGILYLAMEYVEGETLTALIGREGALSAARAAELVGQIAEGLHSAHALGIVHRDLKPDNILVTRHHDGREWVKIVDFGIAKQMKQADQTVTSLGVAIGTPEYMSPEQLAGETLDARTDLYSLGLVLFNMLTGQLPHRAMTSKQSLVQRLTAKPLTLAEVAPAAPWSPRLQKALDRALAPEPDDRYSNVGDFARDVRGAAGLATVGSLATTAAPALVRPAVDARGTADVRGPSSRATVVLPRTARAGGGWGRGLLVAATLLVVVGGAGAAVVGPQRALGMLGGGAPARRAPLVVSQQGAADSLAADTVALVARTDSSATVRTALSPMDAGQRLESAALGGDSTASRDALMQTAAEYQKEIMTHVDRARELVANDELEDVGTELKTAWDEYKIMLAEHASSPQLKGLRDELQAVMDEAIAACHESRTAEIAAGGRPFRCEHPAKTGMLMVYDPDPATKRP